MSIGADELLWTPPEELLERSEMAQLARLVGARDYQELWRWSVADIEGFWRTIWDRYGVDGDGDPSTVLSSHAMPGARWFPDVALSFPEHVFRDKDQQATALHYASEDSPAARWSWRQLYDETAAVRAGLVRLGVQRGDRVVGYLPNVPEALAAFLAAASLGAVWSCCSPDFGARTVIDRFSQIAPKVLLAVDGYAYNGQWFDRSNVVAELQTALPTVEQTIMLGSRAQDGDWRDAFPATRERLSFARVPFEHPLWIVYSSGTTGLPKPIVHGHGGPLLEHLKLWRLHHDVRPGDVNLWFTTTGWIMWNYLVSALLSPGSIVLYDGSPGYPGLERLWELADDVDATLLGAGAAFFHACMRAEIEPCTGRDLARLRALGSTGSPLAPDAFDWVANRFGGGMWLASTSGGTDVASAFFGGAPLMPVHRGELPARLLGVKAEAWDDDRRPLIDEVGELVISEPMPSMPVSFWNDPGDQRYRDSYFSTFPGVWRQGDWVRITPRGSAVIYGRSDSTINRAGVRMGTSEIYAAVLALEEVADALAVDVPPPRGIGDAWLGLFVVLSDGFGLTDDLRERINRSIRMDCSPRHVPDEVVVVPALPRTLTGKLLEVPIKRILMGVDSSVAVKTDAIDDPEALHWFIDFARERSSKDD